MKKFLKGFLLRGLVAAGFGPVVLAVIYGILGQTGVIDSISPGEVCAGFLSVTLLAFLVAGMAAIYQVERLTLICAIGIHGAVLYAAYILIYLLNGWLRREIVPVLVFTGVFAVGYGLVWLVIYLVTRAKARKLNRMLRDGK